MKKPLLILAMIFLFQNMMYADEARGKGKRFEENKVRILGNIDKKIGFLRLEKWKGKSVVLVNNQRKPR